MDLGFAIHVFEGSDSGFYRKNCQSSEIGDCINRYTVEPRYNDP